MKTANIVGVALVFVAAAAVSQQPPGGRMAPPANPSASAAPADTGSTAVGATPSAPAAPPSLPPSPSVPAATAPKAVTPTIGGGGPGVAFRNLDTNSDGRLALGELRDPTLISSFRQLDANNDGSLSELEYGNIGNPTLRR
jgi:hypothetical protein